MEQRPISALSSLLSFLTLLVLTVSPAEAGVIFTVDPTTDGASLNALAPGDTVTLDITIRASGLPIALDASVNDYDNSVVSVNSGDSLISDDLFNVGCVPGPEGPCFGGIANLLSTVQEESFGPGIRTQFYIGATAARDEADGSLDSGIVTGVRGDAQFRIVFDVLAPGITTLQIGVFDEYGGIYLEDPGDELRSNTSITLVVAPEPGTAVLLGLGLSGLAARRRS